MAVTKTQYVGPEDEIIFIDSWGVKRAQRINYTPSFNNVEVGEIGALGLIETIPELITTSVSLETNAIGSIDTMQMIFGEQADTPYVSGTVNQGRITENDLANAIVDIVVAIREGDTFRRSRLLPNQYLTGIDLSYNVGGVASENYSFAGDQDEDFIGLYADYRVLRGTYISISGFSVLGNYGTGYTPYRVTLNNQTVCTGNNIYVVNSGTYTRVIATGVSTMASDSRLRLHMYKNSPITTFETRQAQAGVNVPGYAALMGRQIVPYLGGSTVSAITADKALRLQSVNISGDFSRDDLKELGNQQLVGKVLNIPVKINVTAEALESDLEMYCKMVGGATWTAWQAYQAAPTTAGVHLTPDMLASQGLTLIVEIYKERTSPTTKMQTITLSGLSVSGKSGEIAVNSRGGMTFALQGSYITISGLGVNPLS